MRDLTTVEIIDAILGDFNSESNTESAIEAYVLAKKVANAASIAMKMTGDFATQALLDKGGKGSNSFASYSIVRQFDRHFEPDELRDTAINQYEAQKTFSDAIKERIAEIEKQMEKDGRMQKVETGQTIKVTLLEKI